MTVIDQLRSAGVREEEAQPAASAIAAALPVSRNVWITEEILDGAGDVALVSMPLAEEEAQQPKAFLGAVVAEERASDERRRPHAGLGS